jgi:transposase
MTFFESHSPRPIGVEGRAKLHYWARELTKPGPWIRLMPAKDVKASMKRNKRLRV